jgi:rubrerythrin
MADDNEESRKLIESGICPRCGNRLVHEEGCTECPVCGWSICDEA